LAGLLEDAARWAIENAKRCGRGEVGVDDLLLGALVRIARFGIAQVGPWSIDLVPFGIDWRDASRSQNGDVAYSNEAVELLDRAARIAKADGGSPPRIVHLLACFADSADGAMGELKRRHGIDSAAWRGALAGVDVRVPRHADLDGASAPGSRPYLSPEEAAAYLGVHIQTVRGYIRTGKLPALRIAGERAIRIRREDLSALLEPFLED